MALKTVKELEALSHKDNGRRVSLGESLYGTVRVSKDGSISLHVFWRYKIDSKVRQASIGTWKRSGGKSLKELREKKNELAKVRASGHDPIELKLVSNLKKQADQIEAKQNQVIRLQDLEAQNARLTVNELFNLWRKTDLQKRADKGSEALRSFERDVFPVIGNLAAADVKKAQIQLILDNMLSRGVKRMAERVISDLRQLFGFAIDRDFVEVDPTARIKKSKIGGSKERDRVLSEAELITLFQTLPHSGLIESSQCALLIQLATLTRIGEVLAARWENVDLRRRLWTLPETKNGRRHIVHLNDLALTLLKVLHRQTGHTEWVFPASRVDGPVCSKTVTKQVADRQRGGSESNHFSGRSKQTSALCLPGGQWRPHDLRRTGATLMAELGVLPDVIEKCLNHTEQVKIKRIYQRAQYDTHMREAWSKLGRHLDFLQSSSSCKK